MDETGTTVAVSTGFHGEDLHVGVPGPVRGRPGDGGRGAERDEEPRARCPRRRWPSPPPGRGVRDLPGGGARPQRGLTGVRADHRTGDRLPRAAGRDAARTRHPAAGRPDPHAPYGLRGAGETSTLSSPPAVATAVRNATGLPLTRVPIRPHDIALKG